MQWCLAICEADQGFLLILSRSTSSTQAIKDSWKRSVTLSGGFPYDSVVDFTHVICRSNVERANATVPAHSQIKKELIVVTRAENPLIYTAKNAIIRGPALAQYQDQIDEL